MKISCLSLYHGLLYLGLFFMAGCQTSDPNWEYETHSRVDAAVRLKVGDQLTVNFPGAPSLNFQAAVRQDGKISLPLTEFKGYQVEGKTLDLVRQEVLDIYEPQLQIKEIEVSVQSAPITVYVSGAVLQPGKVMVSRQISVLEAVMESGGFIPDSAQMDKIFVIRHKEGQRYKFYIDLKPNFGNAVTNPFYLENNDIVHVPQSKNSLF